MHEVDFIRRLCGNTPSVIFDIGACDFRDSIMFKQQFPNAEVWAFEPDRDNLNRHQVNAVLAGVHVVPVAVSDDDTEIVFYPSDNLNGQDWKFSGSTKKPVVKVGTDEGIHHAGLHYNLDGYVVPAVRVDSFCELNGITSVDYMHIDAQGAEYNVIKSLGIIRPKVIYAETAEFDTYETGTTLPQFDELMLSMGYRIDTRLQYDTLYVLD